MENIIGQVISALLTTILALVGMLKWYLPKHDMRLHNPHLEELKAIREQLVKNNDQSVKGYEKVIEAAGIAIIQAAVNTEHHKELVSYLNRIEEKVSK